ncbi:MAG TPA: polysaccharide lyase [Leptospiraceae bacterium]|nr:polysaccharide lyase [Leptospiraceae bacterium]HNI97495.1 polysaccharide lyase [Leptospiraceae bacterium]HNM04046.1 polysaccharide lyase [Leptospiraceae bacterium]HNN06253.1 polysaccharide lyase [Leptospiraceae bacterium]
MNRNNKNNYNKSFIYLTAMLALLSFCKKEKENRTAKNLGLMGLAYISGTTMTCTDSQLQKTQAGRVYQTGFESSTEFSSFYSVPQNYQSAATHEYVSDQFHGGSKSHKAYIYAKGPTCAYPMNCNHRGYPAIQLNKLPSGGFKTPVYVEFYTYMDMTLSKSSDWFSFATFSADASDAWRRVVLINTDSKNYAYLMHVPNHNQNVWTYQNTALPYPQKKWVKISACLDFDPSKGSAKVWQDDVLISTANVSGGCGVLEQAHFGLYADPGITQGTIYNDDLLIKEVSVCP